MSYQSTPKAHLDGTRRLQGNDFKVRLLKQDLFQLLKSEQTKEFCFWLKSYVRNIPHTFVKCDEERQGLLKDQVWSPAMIYVISSVIRWVWECIGKEVVVIWEISFFY